MNKDLLFRQRGQIIEIATNYLNAEVEMIAIELSRLFLVIDKTLYANKRSADNEFKEGSHFCPFQFNIYRVRNSSFYVNSFLILL